MEEEQKRRIRHDVPKGAIILSRQEAIAHQMNTVYEWRPRSEVWPLLFGRGILVGAASLTGAYINYRFRRKLRLLSHGWFPAVVGVTLVPGMMTALCSSEFVLYKLLLLEVPCTICFESKSALIQTCCGLFLPMMMVPIANFSVTVGTGVYNVPHLSDWRRLFKIIYSTYQPMIPQLALIFTIHALLAGFITYSQVKSFLYMQDVQYLVEQEEKTHLHASNV